MNTKASKLPKPKNESNWDNILTSLNMIKARLMFISPYEDGRRVYHYEDKIIKIALNTADEDTKADRRQELEGEFNILTKCKGISEVPEPISIKKNEIAQILELKYFKGIDCVSYLSMGYRIPFKLLFWNLPIILFRLSARGISHNDLRLENILLSGDEKIKLIDFDQASKTKIFDALFRNFGLRRNGSVNISFLTLIKTLIKIKIGRKNVDKIRRILGKKVHISSKIPAIPESAPKKLHELQRAWTIAKNSNASSPGVPVAYYSLNVNGIHFPGERSWESRWTILRKITDFKGKIILELGCNMGLLSCSLLREKQVESAIAVDVDADILNSARHVASAYDVSPIFLQINLDCDEAWEERLRSFSPDIVFALNVLNWIKNKKRLLNFLGEFRELIFEGHESFDIERRRLEEVGFNDFRIVTLTERKRPLILCRK